MIHLDISILYQVALFVFLWLVLSKLLFNPYQTLLDESKRKTTGAQHDSSELEHEGGRLKSQYEQRIAQAQMAAYAAKDAILQDARQQREKILSQARDEAASHLEQVRRDIAGALEHEKRQADVEVSVLARD